MSEVSFVTSLLVGYFQVAESKITVSQVIGALHACPYCSAVSKSRYFQVAEFQVIALLQVVSIASMSQEIGLLPGCRIPGHQCSPCVSIGCQRRCEAGYFQVAESQVMSGLLLSARYFQVADSNAIASQVMAENPFARVVSDELAGFAGVPGHVSPPEIGYERRPLA
jgi:hypothetical protein